MNKMLLNLALLPTGLYKAMGADTVQLRALLQVKLMMDDRRPASFGKRKTEKKNRRFTIALSMMISFFMGLFYVMPMIMFEDRLLGLCGYFTLFLLLLSFTLIVDFSTILIDTRDKYIVLPRPVNDKTLFLSRLLHIFVYLFRIVLPMAIPGWVTIGLLAGWTAVIWFPVAVMLLVCTAVFLVMGAYLFMLRIAPAERFKDILGYFQIGMSVLVFALTYLGPRAMSSEQFRTLRLHDMPWLIYLPSYWIAATWSWLHYHSVPPHTIYYSILAVLVPLVAITATIKYFAPTFTAKLGGIDAVEPAPPKAGTKAVKGGRLYQRLSTTLNRRPEAQAGFMLAWLQTARSRAFKMKVYPFFGYIPIYFVWLMLQSKQPLRDVWAGLPQSNTFLVLLYMSAIVMLQALSMVTTSDQFKASWIYYATPLEEPGALMAGAYKAIWIKYFLPPFILIAALVCYVWGTKTAVDILLALVNVTFFAMLLNRVGNRKLPFSQLDQVSATGSRVMRMFLSMTILGSLGVGHYAAVYFNLIWLKLIFLALSGGMLWLVWDSYAHTKWTDMKAVDL